MFHFKNSLNETGDKPLLIGILGPTGGGKTYSALRIAKGIQSIRGGNIVGIDTEASRMLHYNEFGFQYLSLKPPFGSDRYLEAIKAASVEAKGGVVIVDSMSHEHEGEDGLLDFYDKEFDRMSSGKTNKNAYKMLAWGKPKAARRRLINGLLQMNVALIFCFRAKEKMKMEKGKDPFMTGWEIIGGPEFGYEMIARFVLPPMANGVPDWSIPECGFTSAKLPESFKDLKRKKKQLDEELGVRFAKWAQGIKPAPKLTVEQKTVKSSIDDGLIQKVKTITNVDDLNKYWSEIKEFVEPEEKDEIIQIFSDRKAEINQ